jgi:hypothetical protein
VNLLRIIGLQKWIPTRYREIPNFSYEPKSDRGLYIACGFAVIAEDKEDAWRQIADALSASQKKVLA